MVLKCLHGKKSALLGIDISSQSIKLLAIVREAGRYQVTSYAQAMLPAEAIEGNTIKDATAIGDCLRNLLSQHKILNKEVALAVPDSAVISNVIQMHDGLNDAELEELILLEADKYIPYSLDEINIDFEILGHSAQNSATIDVLIVASRSQNVNTRVEAVRKAGLTTKIVDVESFAMERAVELFQADLPARGQDKIIAVIDIGAQFTHLFVLEGMRIIFSREDEFGGLQLTQAISQHYQLAWDKALLLQKEQNYPEDYRVEVLEPFTESLLLHIKRMLQFFYSSNHHRDVDQILLAGGVARLPNLDKRVSDDVGVPARIANPFVYMNIDKRIDAEQLHVMAPSLMVACGLALRHME
ncbi:MAG: type IV pilus assembly protein PilM [Legionellaceae bacterium]|nr:type IV pilus assembly protein PilM [Legionellaceae bacterium]